MIEFKLLSSFVIVSIFFVALRETFSSNFNKTQPDECGINMTKRKVERAKHGRVSVRRSIIVQNIQQEFYG